ncbi:MAG: 4'-phosphopantetheinyl transferase superfamily protein [Desulfobulbaceae bacterium]|nr:4'-phosphopantetheinyl transferase superfamily protein [Desulfobulbaceae bacterium]
MDTSNITQTPIISGFMKNSKGFPCKSWMEHSLLSADQITTCRSLLLRDESDLALAVIGLKGLGADLSREGQTVENRYLNPCEQTRFNSFSFPKRKREWLGGRIAAKKAAIHLLPNIIPTESAYHSLQVDNDPAGRPYLLNQECRVDSTSDNDIRHPTLPEISISHSGEVAAALAVTRSPCGLDVQRITAKAISVQERFASSAEQAVLKTAPLLQKTGEAEALTLLWAAKESLRKAIACHPLLSFNEVHLCHLEETPHDGLIARCTSPRLHPEPLPPVFLALSEGYAWAITINYSILIPL